MRYLALFLCIFFLVTCTATPSATTPTSPLAPSPVPTAFTPPQPLPTIGALQIKDLALRNTAFALAVYRQATAQNDDNFIFSPYSLSLAFSMLYAGARGNTETQLANTFHYLPQETQHTTFRQLAQQVNAPPLQANLTGNDGAPFQLNIANATWGQKGFPFLDTFNTTLRENYNAEIQQVNFMQQSPEVADTINNWIANATQDRIKNLIPPDALDANTRLVLVNAVYFKGSWKLPFYPGETKTGTFTLADDSTIEVPFMFKQYARIPFLETIDFQAISYPYLGEKTEMLFILPKEGRFQDVESSLVNATFNNIRTADLHDVDITLPRFKFETDLPLSQLLQSLGVTDAFEAHADFSTLSKVRGLYLSDALHRAVISVNETGTEAAAATVLPMHPSAFERAEVNFNRPFLFAIVEHETGSILFLGRVMNPAP